MTTRWCITDFTMDTSFWQGLINNGDVIYFGYGQETCPSTQRAHWQGWATTDRKTVKAMRKMMAGRHVEPMKGTLKANDTYCSKENEMVHMGMRPSNVNSNDIGAGKQIIENGGTVDDVIMQGFSLNVIKYCRELVGARARKRAREENTAPEVVWIYGPTGTGKSRTARQVLNDPWVSGDDLKWFDGYEGQEDVIIDDFRGDQAKFSWLLRLTDRYPLRVQVKGGHTLWQPKRIYITSCSHPTDCYRGCGEKIDQLLRRITNIIHMEGQKNVCEVLGNTALGPPHSPSAKRRRINPPNPPSRGEQTGDMTENGMDWTAMFC